MTAASFIDLFLTPLAGGIGAIIGVSMMAKRDPEKFEVFSRWRVRIFIGLAVALLLFAFKMI